VPPLQTRTCRVVHATGLRQTHVPQRRQDPGPSKRIEEAEERRFNPLVDAMGLRLAANPALARCVFERSCQRPRAAVLPLLLSGSGPSERSLSHPMAHIATNTIQMGALVASSGAACIRVHLFFAPIQSTQPHKLAYDPVPTRSGTFVYSTRPPFRNGVFFFACAGWLFAHYEVAADLALEDTRPARKKRLAKDKVRTNVATLGMCLGRALAGSLSPMKSLMRRIKMCLTEDP
jgi:hypothetical protein